MPVYNTEPYLRQCLDSIIRQSYVHWELIAVDDFSTDNSAKILKQYSQIDSRIKYVKNDFKGIIPALKKAFDISQGSMIHRMDSDDLMPLDKLENLSTILAHHGLGHVATGKVRYFSDDFKVQKGFRDYSAWINQHIDQDTIFQDVFMECPIASPAWLMYRDDINEIGGITNDRYPEDYDLVFRMYVHGLIPKGSRQIVHHWRDWAHRASRTKEEYADQLFYDLKLYYFLNHKHHKAKPVILWGAGTKGKKLFRKLAALDLKCVWVTENHKKAGRAIYGATLAYPNMVPMDDAQVIVAVSQPTGKKDIRKRLEINGKKVNEDLFFFC